jgi:hypothetical protein
MAFLLMALQGLVGLGSLVCFIMVLIKMFQTGQSTMAIVCIVLAFCGGLGILIAFIMGWINAAKWAIQNVMYAWTGLVVVGILLSIISAVTTSSAS